jgi:putative nucleotidyltransferase with HDIG domain
VSSPGAIKQANSDYWLSLAREVTVDWGDVARRLPFAGDMQACIQDPTYHAEGDVWTHTVMVVEELRRRRGELPVDENHWPGLFLAALLHDIAKPITRSEEVDITGRLRVHHHGHARIGAIMAWEFLWRLGLPRFIREQVFHLVRWHQRPFHLTFAPTLEHDAITFSQIGRWSELLALAEADNLGRVAPNTDETAATLDLLRQEIIERSCLDRPWPFPSDTARVWFGRQDGRSPYFNPPAPIGSHVIVLSGLPGAGKDTYCRTSLPDWPQVSLDQWRERLDIAPDSTQGKVIQAAKQEAREHLRAKRRFVWNATNVSRQNRDQAIGLCLDYDAFVEVHAFDPPPDQLFAQNRDRGSQVPSAVIERLLRKWEPPTILEAHCVVWVH